MFIGIEAAIASAKIMQIVLFSSIFYYSFPYAAVNRNIMELYPPLLLHIRTSLTHIIHYFSTACKSIVFEIK